MPNVTGLTLDELRSKTRSQIMTAINAFFSPMSKRDLIVWLLDATATNERQVVTYYPDGQVKLVTTAIQDIETGARLSSQKVQFAYFASGEIRLIRVKNYDADGNELTGQGWRIESQSPGAQPVRTVE